MINRTLRIAVSLILCAMCILPLSAQKDTVVVSLIETSDVHGRFFPYDFINNKNSQGTLSRVLTYVNQVRKEDRKSVV